MIRRFKVIVLGTASRLPLPFTGGARGGHLSSSHSTNTCPPLIPFVHGRETSNEHLRQQTWGITKKFKSAIPIICLLVMLLIAPAANAAPNQSIITIETGKGQVVKLSTPAASILLANPEVADVQARTPREVFITGKTIGETTLHAYDAKDNQIISALVKIVHNQEALNQTIRAIAPDSNVKLSSTAKGMLITGDVSTPSEAEAIARVAGSYTGENQAIMNMMDIKGASQVMLKVRIAEVSKTNLKTFGINLQNLLSRGSFSLGLAVGRDFIDDATGALILPVNANALTFNNRSGGANIQGMVEALEKEGLARTLAEPNLTTTSGKKASFLAGGEVPIPVPSAASSSIGIEYHQFGISLSFTPTIMGKNKISLDVATEVSSLSEAGSITVNGFQVPSFSVRRASSSVELGSGQTIAVAGLLQNDINNQVSKFPWLGDVPVLGTLFRSTNFQNNETELVILVTPYVVKAVDDNSLTLPGANLVQPNDFERVFLGKLVDYRKKGRNFNQAVSDVRELKNPHGKIGYILE